ncbi:PREDICTED: uncharacterized protein LOC109481049 [Branchiostoma belcheri]|uniref:Uncharacterized protein LOC109481049 n=1 Tax=Branchiostoma belcheri TaxID=7741 RepID=A0A6P4ZQH8_BRABE|nr:PREDICTED: uncharacterized protein LOC109481049 [Branchiostoma belcheri]KAI8481647.1 hypothetical protein Bbelb_406480 [Branchiostoma belcheri]
MESSEKRQTSEPGRESVLDIADDTRVWIVPENEFDPQFLDQLSLVSFPTQSEWIVSPPHPGQDGLAFWIPVKDDSKKSGKRKLKSPYSVIRPTVPPKRKEGYLPKALAGVVDTLWASRGFAGHLSALLNDTTRPFAPLPFEHVTQLRAKQQVTASPGGDGCTEMSGVAETRIVDPNLSKAVADIVVETNSGASEKMRDAIDPVVCTPS